MTQEDSCFGEQLPILAALETIAAKADRAAHWGNPSTGNFRLGTGPRGGIRRSGGSHSLGKKYSVTLSRWRKLPNATPSLAVSSTHWLRPRLRWFVWLRTIGPS